MPAAAADVRGCDLHPYRRGDPASRTLPCRASRPCPQHPRWAEAANKPAVTTKAPPVHLRWAVVDGGEDWDESAPPGFPTQPAQRPRGDIDGQ